MILVLCLAAAILGCDRADPAAEPEALEAVMEFAAGTVRIETATDTLVLTVEVAETEPQRRMGLMRRESLPQDAGMIFLFPVRQPADAVFWMYNTLIPLSIAFIGEDGRIGSIRDMEPCPSPYPQWCPSYPAGAPFISALEVNLGYFAAHGIKVGDRVVLEKD